MTTEHDSRAQSLERFSRFATHYVTSSTHASGYDLDQLLAFAVPRPHWIALDIATGGGHTALKLAPHVRQVIALDLSSVMLQAARTFHHNKGMDNIVYLRSDAELLPFEDKSLDLITCRIAPHHFPYVHRFVMDAARVLRPGGRLVIQDQVVPEIKRAAAYLEAFERLRDPSHNHAYNEYEWRGMFLDAELRIEQMTMLRKTHSLVPWAQMQDCPPDVIARLQIMLVQAPQAVADFVRPVAAGTPDARFDHVNILISGIKS
jgi:ubiquinone/menaquinone biosynthesis C-methylase UbiE